MPRTDRPADQHDASRREFFRTFSRQTVHNAGAVIGAATELRRTGFEAARELLGTDPLQVAPGEPTSDPPPRAASTAASPDSTYRSAFRYTGDSIVLLDQRELPARIVTIAIRDATEAASAIRSGVVNGGPVSGQVAAYAMALAARTAVDRPETGRQQQIRAAAGALRAARRDLQVVTTALDQMEARYDAVIDGGAAPEDMAAALEAEADRIAGDANVAHATIGRLAGESIAPVDDGEVLQLLFHGDLGPLSCGMVGIGTSLLRALTDGGRPVHAWLTEAAPGREGARIGALQLSQNDVPHTVIPDSAVGWLFANRRMDVAFLRGDRLAVNGDTSAIVGGLVVAQLAAASAVPVDVLAPDAALDASVATGDGMRFRQASSAEAVAARVRGTPMEARRPQPVGAELKPGADVIPAALIARIVTETGVHLPPLRGRGATG